MRRVLSYTFAAAILSALFVFQAGAQESAPKKKPPKLTTDDVLADRTAGKTVELPAETSGKAGPEAKATEAKGQPAAAKSVEEKVSPEEKAWREEVRRARERLKAAEHAAEEGELRVTDIRNRLNSAAQSTRQRNQNAADLEMAGERLAELRRQEREAQENLNRVLEIGRQKRFLEEPAASKPPEGDSKANEEYYRNRYLELTGAVQAAARRVQLYENRVRDVNQQMANNVGKGDNFYLARLQQDRDEALQKLAEAREAYDKAERDIEALKQEGRRAGVPPGIFR